MLRRRYIVGLGAALLLPCLVLEAQEYQRHFGPEEFEARWAKVFERIGGQAIAVVQGAADPGGYIYPRQTNSFYYLCGVENSYAYLMLNGRERKVTLYLPRSRGSDFERVLTLNDPEKVKRWTGVDEVLDVEELRDLDAKIIYTPFSPAEGQGQSRGEIRGANRRIAVDYWDGRVSKEENFRELLQERNPEAEIRDLSPILDELRSIKSEREIALLRRVGQLSALAVNEAMRATEPGVYEYHLDAVGRYVFLANGARLEGYRSIIGAGVKNIGDAHYYYNSCPLIDGDLVLMDYAPDFGYYVSDIGRMWPVNGEFNDWQRQICQFILDYHKEILKRIRPGVSSREIMDEAAEAMEPIFARTEFLKPEYERAARRLVETGGGVFSHTVGMAVHDVGGYRGALKPGQVFAVDPQLRVPEEGLYMRIEDTVVVTEDGVEVLTGWAPWELDEIEKMVQEKGMIQDYAPAFGAGVETLFKKPVMREMEVGGSIPRLEGGSTPKLRLALPPVVKPPAELECDPFYQKYVSSDGLPILSSAQVSDEALWEADYLIDQMLANRPDVREALIERGVRVMVMSPTEMTTDVPEQRHMTPKDYWDRRARGLGGRLTSCGEENLLNLEGDRYFDENILIHEFGHCIHSQGLRRIDENFQTELQALYDKSLGAGLWVDTYAGSNASELWAEGVQSWFDCNRQSRSGKADGVHNHVNTREELIEYDPDLAKFIEKHLGKSEWRYVRYEDRNMLINIH